MFAQFRSGLFTGERQVLSGHEANLELLRRRLRSLRNEKISDLRIADDYKRISRQITNMVETQEVVRAAKNARINLEDGEAEQFTEEFEEILDTFEKLEEVDTSDVEPAFHPIDVESKTREDEVEESLDSEEVFENTENVEDGKFKGPSA